MNIPAGERIDAAIPGGNLVPGLGNARQEIGYGWYKYAGPKPPRGRQHLYRFTIYAIDAEIDFAGFPTKNRFMKMAKGHILQQDSIVGKYERERSPYGKGLQPLSFLPIFLSPSISKIILHPPYQI